MRILTRQSSFARRLVVIGIFAMLFAPTAYAAGGDPVAPTLIALMLITVAAALGGRLMQKLGQPAVLGELLIGVLVGNIAFWLGEPIITVLREGGTLVQITHTALTSGLSPSEAARQLMPASAQTEHIAEILGTATGALALSVYQFIDQLSRIAVIVLLFLVGLETTVVEMRRVGLPSFVVAVIGVVTPFALGFAVVEIMLDAPVSKAIFIGAIFTATSVGITARVFRDLGVMQRTEAKIVLGAAVIDDVLGLIILAIVSGLVVTGSISVGAALGITLKATVFLVGSIAIGVWITPRLVRRLARVDIRNLKLLYGLGFAFLLSWLADVVGLATIVGAFAAGLILEEFFLEQFKGPKLGELLAPIETLVVPIFFVLMGLQVKLETLADPKVLLMAGVLTLTAIIGKVVAGFGVSSKLDRLTIGVGMMPRGEVGLIFASIGKGLGVVNDAMFSAVVIMVMITTLLTPPLLKITLARSASRAA